MMSSATGDPSTLPFLAALLSSYLVAWLVVVGLAVGALAVVMLHDVTGGDWGDALRPPLVAIASTMPLVALGFVPVAIGLRSLYRWAIDGSGPHAWLNPGFFIARAIVCLVLWTVLARLVAHERPRSPEARRRSAIGLIVYTFTASLAAVDWIMSLMPEWHSTVFGLLVAAGQMLIAFAFAVAWRTWNTDDDAPERRNDFGNLLLTFLMLSAYLAFVQYLIIWIGNLPGEAAWYLPRVDTGWRWVGIGIAAGGFALPFCALLSRDLKRDRRRLGIVAAWLVVWNVVDVYWWVVPSLRTSGPLAHPLALVGDLVVVGVVGALWFAVARRGHRLVAPPRHVDA